MHDLIAEARRFAASPYAASPTMADLLRRLADVLERSEARAERLRVERDRLAQGLALMCLHRNDDLNVDRAISQTMRTLGIEAGVDSSLAEALAAHDRECEGER